MEKQYSVKFFTSFLEALQKVCRDFVDFEDSIELSGYLSLEIDNVKKERYVLSEMLNSSGNVISESYCTKAFKTVRKYQQQSSGRENIMPRSQTVMNRSQRDSHHSYITDSHHQNSSSSYVNYKDHSSDSRVPKQWGHDVYGSNSRISPLRGSGHQFGDSGTGTHELKTSTPKRSLSAIVIDDAPSNKRGRSDSVPDDKSLSEMTSQQGMCKLDADSMQTSFSDTSHSQTTPQMPAASSSAQSSQANNNSNNNNHNISSQASSSHQNSESIRLPLQMTIKDEPDIPCVDIDLSELDSADSMGGSDSGSGYPSAEGTSSGAYRMAANNQGTSETYQNKTSFRSLSKKINLAFTAVEEGLVTVGAAARLFGVSKQALYYHVKVRRIQNIVKHGYQEGLEDWEKKRIDELLAACNNDPEN